MSVLTSNVLPILAAISSVQSMGGPVPSFSLPSQFYRLPTGIAAQQEKVSMIPEIFLLVKQIGS